MDPPTSYIFYAGFNPETDGLAQGYPDALADSSQGNLPRFVPNTSLWYPGSPDYPGPAAHIDGEHPVKRRKLHPSPPFAAWQGPLYGQDPSQLATHISALSCPIHGQNALYSQQWAVADQVSMPTHTELISRRVVELGRLVCSCTAMNAQEPDAYDRLIGVEQSYDQNQQYVAEKFSLALSTDVRTFPAQAAWETDTGRYSNQNVISPHEQHGQQLFWPRISMNSSNPIQGPYTFNGEPPKRTIPLSSYTIAPAHAQPEFSDLRHAGPRPGKRGPFRDLGLRRETAYTRKIGCCIRCKMQRIRCDKNPEDPDGICLTCKKFATSKTWQLPCLRYKIADIILYKSGQVPGLEWTKRWSNEISGPIDTWASERTRTIYISEGYSQYSMELQVREFVPLEGDKLERTWDYKGQKKSVSIPPFALVDMDSARKAFARHVDANINDTLRKVTGSSARMMRATYLQAWRLGQRQDVPEEVLDIIQATIRLWTSTRLNTISCFIVGTDTLDMPADILDGTSPTPGKVPLPPVLGAQLNLVMIHQIQAKLRKSVLDKLQNMVQRNKQSTWLATYFVDFILLHNASMIIAHDAGYARKHGINRRFAREDKVREYHMGANIVLAYFHYCNKGLFPFSEECSDYDLKSLAQLSGRDIEFVRATRKYAKHREPAWKRLRQSEEYDHPEFYISQMFEQNWVPRSMVV